MSIRSTIKHFVFGQAGLRPRLIRGGLLSGLHFLVDTSTQSQRLVGLAEREIAPATRNFAAAAQSAIDIGAAEGWYSLYFASLLNIRQVIAAEPVSALINQIQSNFALNVSTCAGKLSCIPRFVGPLDSDGWCTVDSIAHGLPRPIVLKIDVDGGEADVLRGASRLLASRQALFIIETHSRELENDCISLLQEARYECVVIRNAWYRYLVPETRLLPHNRWLIARPCG